MRALVLYDSAYGNTEAIAQTIAQSMPPTCEAEAVQLNNVHITDLVNADLLIVGSPTQGGRPTSSLQRYLTELPGSILSGTYVAAFDTRFAPDHSFWLRQLTKIFGFAAPRIATLLKNKGGTLVTTPKGFIVNGKEGPLRQGEIGQAKRWAQALGEWRRGQLHQKKATT